jgi:hypothetical protein
MIEDNSSTDLDQSFAEPYSYNRTLVTVPGIPRPVSNLACINQSVIEFVRHQFVPRDDDVWLATYPKAGTTWMQNILSYILYNEPNSPDGICVGLTPDENIVWFEAQCIPGGSGATGGDPVALTAHAQATLDRVNANPKRRCFKSHSPLGILEPLITSQGKVIHVARNPRDISVSMWHHTRSKSFGYEGPFDHFVRKLYLPGNVESDSWWDFVIPYCAATKRWEAYNSESNRNSDGSDLSVPAPPPASPSSAPAPSLPSPPKKNYTQIMTVWYEEIKESPVEMILRVAEFLNCSLTRSDAERIAQCCSLEVMREAEQSSGLKLSTRVVLGKKAGEGEEGGSGTTTEVCGNQIREGKVGGWKKYFTEDLLEEFNAHHQSECQRYQVEEKGILPSWIIHPTV